MVSRPSSIAMMLKTAKAGHERRDAVKAAAKRAHQEPCDERAEARDDAGTAGAEPDRGRADVGREQLRQIDRIAREHAEDEKAEDRQDPWVPGFEFGKDQIEDQPEDNRAGAVQHDRQPTANGVTDEAKCNIAADPTIPPRLHSMMPWLTNGTAAVASAAQPLLRSCSSAPSRATTAVLSETVARTMRRVSGSSAISR
jgi:hypothetical protein